MDKPVYSPSSKNIFKFDLVVDHDQWIRLCQMASDFNTSVDAILALSMEHLLEKSGYPRGVLKEHIKIDVTLQDLMKNSVPITQQLMKETTNESKDFFE